MGVVIPFVPKAKVEAAPPARPGAGSPAATASPPHGAADQAAVLSAAQGLIERCHTRYGFVLMRDGLPTDPALLMKALTELHRGLSMLDGELQLPRRFPTFGIYFGGRTLGWFEDGYGGMSGLSVPDDIDAETLAAFLRPRLTAPFRRSRD